MEPPTHPDAGEAQAPNRATDRRWIVWVPIGILVIVFAVAFSFNMYVSWPLSSGREEPRPSEARAALGAMKDRARVVYMRTGRIPQTMADLDMPGGALDGGEFSGGDYVVLGGKANEWKAKCIGVYQKEPRDLEVRADLVTGSSSFNR